MSKFKRAQRGFTLVELAIVLAIIGLVIAGIWTAAASVSRRNREDKAMQYLLQIVQNIRKLYSRQTSNAGITEANMIAAGVVPAEMKTPLNTIVDPWGGAVTFDAPAGTMTFSVSFDEVPQASCVVLLQKTTANHMDIGLVGASGSDSVILPPTTQDVLNACADEKNLLTWTYNLRN